MSRQEDFDKAADEYSVGCDEQDDRIYAELHYKRGCEYGYQYAVEKACEWLRENMEYWLGDYNLAEDELEDNQIHYSAMIEELRKAMEE